MSGRLARLASVVILVLTAGSWTAEAQHLGDGAHGVFKEAPLPRPLPAPPRRFLTVGAQLDVNYQFNPIVKQVYDRNGPFGLTIWGNVLFDERVGVGLTAGVQRRAGTGVAPSGEEPPDTVLWQVPIAVEGWLRMALWRNQPVVPYLRAGAGSLLVWERVFSAAAQDPEAEVQDPAAEAGGEAAAAKRKPLQEWMGTKFTLHAAGGVQIRLPIPEIHWEGSMAGASFLSDLYLHIEGWARAANVAGDDLVDLSSVGASAGVTVMF